VYIRSTGEILITGSSFIDGRATTLGGGLRLDGATQLTLDGSLRYGPNVFRGNTAGTDGGGFYTTREVQAADKGQVITIQDTVFDMNSANRGGGFAVSVLGNLPSLTVLQTEFTNNAATDSGGAMALVAEIPGLTVSLENNTGSGNTAGPELCPDYLIYSAAGQLGCVAVDASYDVMIP